MAARRKAAVPAVRDTLPPGAAVVFDAETCSAFARLFRHALAARGYGPALVTRGGRHADKRVD